MKVKFLGTGDSFGTPRAGCYCNVCTNTKSKNKRLRPSIIVKNNKKNILVDVSPDFRQQAMKHKIKKIDYILFTHAHSDHVLGMPDLRMYTNKQGPIDCYANQATIYWIKRNLSFMFAEKRRELCIPDVKMNLLKSKIMLAGIEIMPIDVVHALTQHTYGYRFNDFAYIPDCKEIMSSSREKLRNLDTLVIGALNHLPNDYPTHMNVMEALEVVEDVKPKKTYFTHIAHSCDYYTAKLPKDVKMAFDGLLINI